MARAAASQFGEPDPNIELLSDVRTFDEVRDFLNHQRVMHRRMHGMTEMLLFYTLVEKLITTTKENDSLVAAL